MPMVADPRCSGAPTLKGSVGIQRAPSGFSSPSATRTHRFTSDEDADRRLLKPNKPLVADPIAWSLWVLNRAVLPSGLQEFCVTDCSYLDSKHIFLATERGSEQRLD
eukprot:gene4768-317_t